MCPFGGRFEQIEITSPVHPLTTHTHTHTRLYIYIYIYIYTFIRSASHFLRQLFESSSYQPSSAPTPTSRRSISVCVGSAGDACMVLHRASRIPRCPSNAGSVARSKVPRAECKCRLFAPSSHPPPRIRSSVRPLLSAVGSYTLADRCRWRRRVARRPETHKS